MTWALSTVFLAILDLWSCVRNLGPASCSLWLLYVCDSIFLNVTNPVHHVWEFWTSSLFPCDMDLYKGEMLNSCPWTNWIDGEQPNKLIILSWTVNWAKVWMWALIISERFYMPAWKLRKEELSSSWNLSLTIDFNFQTICSGWSFFTMLWTIQSFSVLIWHVLIIAWFQTLTSFKKIFKLGLFMYTKFILNKLLMIKHELI